ncbi:hypothetical protein HMPREF1218_1423 [Hoylesella pleuritidis F0068]|uniref:Uncharacterized protein n=1 Tax=Hoylesella pleuritidis F0068 TaxID=1081904 RepID=U2LEP9_9BACT|nr:hypothetical protein HMPREF1218_1423 [Hoylesella pleuritidis F0068]
MEDVQAEKRGENKKRSLGGTAFIIETEYTENKKPPQRTALRK